MGIERKRFFLKKSKKYAFRIAVAHVFPTGTFLGALGIRFLENCFFTNYSAEVVLAVLFFWALYRPRLISFTVLILLGLWLDIMETSPFGWTSFIWTFFGFLVWSQRRLLIKAPFGMIWGAFSILASAVILMNGVVFSLVYGCPFMLGRTALIILTTVAIYPGVFCLLSYGDRKIVSGIFQGGSTPRGVVDVQSGAG